MESRNVLFKLCLILSINYVITNDICTDGLGNPWEGVENNRIPADTYAIHYDLYLNPDLTTERFTGRVTIHITATQARDYFVVNIKELTINSYNFSKVEEQLTLTPVEISNACEYTPNEFFIVETASTADPGNYQLYMEFNGTLSGKIVGFYYSTYENGEGQDIPLATTKFEPTYARQAFPCFDEPSFRSTFTITIVRPSNNGYIGLSNMPVAQNETIGDPTTGVTEVTFEKSVTMVTYLVCFIVSDFVYKETILPAMNGDLPFRVYGSQEKIENMQYALDFGASTLLYYEQLFQLGFPLPKSDMAAIPDYSSGATEHWGIITFRETNIFYNRTTSSSSNHQRVSSVIAHEMAHQWFGNLVTLEWWNDLWLNEGFAAYIQYIGVDKYHPRWDMNAQFVIDELQYVFDVDSKLSSHPIVKDVQTADEINAMFDTISYSKGSSVIRMCEGFMGATEFQAGINNFLKDFAYSNAVTQDLWNELQAAWITPDSTRNITEIMDTWTKQMGYPLVTVQQVPQYPNQLRFFQTRFLLDPSAVSNVTESPIFGYHWNIPLSILTSKGNVINAWFYYNSEEALVDIGEGVEWFKVNYQQKGYYRVNYGSPQQWAKMADLCSSMSVSTADRSSLYDDVFALGNSGTIDYDIPLNMSQSLLNETDYVPWSSASKNLKYDIYLLLNSTDVIIPFKDYTQSLVNDIYLNLGWEDGGTHLNSLLRYVIVDLACFSYLESCLTSVGELYASWIQDENYQLPLDTKRKVYWWGQINVTSWESWYTAWNRCLLELDATERNNLYYGLSNSQNVTTLNQYIDMAFDLHNVKSQDFLSILEYIALNPIGMEVSWDWTRENWDLLVDRYTLNDRYLGELIPDITQYFTTPEKLAEMELFFLQNPEAGAGEQYRSQALETVEFNIRWVNSNAPVIKQWLDDYA